MALPKYISVFMASTIFAQAAPPATAEPMIMAQHVVIDSAGFEQPMPAAAIMLPLGWSGQLGISWQIDSCTGKGSQSISLDILSPDGRARVSTFKPSDWQIGGSAPVLLPGMSPCNGMTYNSISEFIDAMAHALGQSLTIVDRRRRPDIEQAYSLALPPSGVLYEDAYSRHSVSLWYEAEDLLLAGSDGSSGTRILLSCSVGFTFSELTTKDGTLAPLTTLQAFPSCYAYQAPEGELNFLLLDAIRDSIVIDPRWKSKVEAHKQNIAQIVSDGVRARHQITIDAAADMSNTIMEIYNSRNANADRMIEAQSDAILGIRRWQDQENGVSLGVDAAVSSVWKLSDGTYFLSDDPASKPSDFGLVGTELSTISP